LRCHSVQVCALVRLAEEVCSQELQYKGCAAAAPRAACTAPLARLSTGC